MTSGRVTGSRRSGSQVSLVDDGEPQAGFRDLAQTQAPCAGVRRQFSDPSVARAYRFRPPYPDQVYELLETLLGEGPRAVVDLGCGLGEIARRFASRVDRIDAVEPSHAMLALARRLPGGEQPNLCWHGRAAEDFAYPSTYGLVVAAESLQWMEWDRVLPAIRSALTPHGSLVLINRRLDTVPWWDSLISAIPSYSTNSDYQPYDLLDELAERGLFRPAGRATTEPVPYSQSVEDYVESWHSRNGLSRDRMAASRASDFDARVREIVTPYAESGSLRYNVQVDVAWGVPERCVQQADGPTNADVA